MRSKENKAMSFKPSQLQISPPDDEVLFESLCLDLYKAKFGDKTQKHGSRGQAQEGVDIFVLDQDIGIQCKKRALSGKIKERELKSEVEKAKQFEPPLKQFIVAVTCKRDANIQKIARKLSEEHIQKGLFSVEIHSWAELTELMDEYPEVYDKHYSHSSIFQDIIKPVQSESRHQELNRITDVLKNQPQTAFDLLKKFEQDKGGELEDKEKYRLFTNKAHVLIAMREEKQALRLVIKALQFNRDNEDANANCAIAYFSSGDLKTAKEFIEKVKKLNPLNVIAHAVEIQIKDKEGQVLEDIVSSVPPAIKEDHQIARVLSHISLKRKKYKETKRWLDILKKQDKVHYADISLNLILEKQDVFSGRRVPEDLKEELKEIISIYHQLNTAPQYSELRRFQANWFLHYALALELNGELDKAISTLEKGVESFRQDDHLKIELSRLFVQKGEKEKSISILEELLGLSSSIASAFVNPTGISQIKITEQSFTIALMLADLYFDSNKNKKVQELLEQAIKSSSIKEEQRREAQQYLIFRLIDFRKIKEAEKRLEALFEKNPNNIFNLILSSKIEGEKEKMQAQQGRASQAREHKDQKIKFLKKAYQAFKDKKYEEQVIHQNNFYFETKKRLRDIQHLAQELYQSEMYQEAEPLLEETTNQNLNHPEIFKLLESYFKNGKNRQVIDLAEDLIKKFPDRLGPVITLFQLYQDLGDAKKAVQYYEKFIQANPSHVKLIPIKLDLIHTYIESEQMENARALLKEEFNINSLSSDLINYLSIAYAKTGSAKKALETQYQNIKKHPGKMELENCYFSMVAFLDKPQLSDFEKVAKEAPDKDRSFLRPKKISLDCYVKIKDINSLETHDIIIEENAETHTPEHKLSQALLGKKAGDKISFMDKTYQILEVKSKYIHKFQEIGKEAELQYGPKTFLRSVSISEKPDKEELKRIHKQFIDPNMSKRQEDLKQLFQAYGEGKTTIGLIAKITGEHSIEIMNHFISSKEDKWISAFLGGEYYQEAREHLEDKSSIILDLFSLIVIHIIKMEESLNKSKFDLYVCQSTIDALKEYGGKTALYAKEGFLKIGSDEKGELRRSFVPAEIIKQDLKFCIKVKTWVEEHCQIKPISSNFILRRAERRKWEKTIGKEFLDPILAVHNDQDSVFLSEDAGLRLLASAIHQEIDSFQEREEKFSQPSVRLFDLIGYLKRKAIIDIKEEIQFKAGLVTLNQIYIPIDHNILLFLLKEAEYLISDIRFQRGLFFLGPVSDLSRAIQATANFFIELCQEPALLPYRRQMIINEVLNAISFGRNKQSARIADQIIQLIQIKARLLPLLQDELYGYITEWRKMKVY